MQIKPPLGITTTTSRLLVALLLGNTPGFVWAKGTTDPIGEAFESQAEEKRKKELLFRKETQETREALCKNLYAQKKWHELERCSLDLKKYPLSLDQNEKTALWILESRLALGNSNSKLDVAYRELKSYWPKHPERIHRALNLQLQFAIKTQNKQLETATRSLIERKSQDARP